MLTLLPLAEGELSPADRAFRACMMDRFGTQRDDEPPPADAFVRDVLAAYRGYWRSSLLRPDQHAEHEARLLARLRALTGRFQAAEIEALEPAVRERLAAAGYRSTLGSSGALRELVLRKGPDFASAGWRDYATCGRAGAPSAMR